MGEGRVLQLVGPSTGGIRRHVMALREGLVEQGWDVDLAAPRGVFPADDVVAEVPIPTGPGPVDAARSVLAVRRLATGYDLVHAHGWKAAWVAAAPRPRAPIVLSVHNAFADAVGHQQAALARHLERTLPRKVDAVIAVSDGLAASVAGATPPARLHVVLPVGPRLGPPRPARVVRAEIGIAADAPLVVGMGRLHPQKGWPTLLEAAAILRRHRTDLRVVIAGEGPLERPLAEAIHELDLDGTATLAAPSTRPEDQLGAADVVAISSVWESGPLVAAEAMALGRPVVATPVGFVPRLIDDGRSGRIVAVGDAPAMAAAIGDLLADPDAAARMGAAGAAAVAERLAPERLVAGVAAVYREVRARS
jgi:glycosyltransferase involved in cell wall biosynthesis